MSNNHREIILDTETTGLSPQQGHKIIEIAAVELINRVSTGKVFHSYVNPKRSVSPEAFRVHGLSEQFLQDKPLFGAIAKDFLDFIGNSTMVIHNAEFDVGFINHELSGLGFNPITMGRVVDTLQIARKKFPGSPASLDALCRRFKISLQARDKHGALIDCELLAMVYLELMGGLQKKLNLAGPATCKHHKEAVEFPARQFATDPKETSEHLAMLSKFNKTLWK